MKSKVSFGQKIFLFLERTAYKFLNASGLGNSPVRIFFSRAKTFLKKRIKPTTLTYLDICVAEHCNFSCYSCSRFSLLAEPEFPDLAITENDLKRLSELSNGNIPVININGGEPLLNQELNEYFCITRKHFPCSHIRLITNGLLLLSQKEDFWESVKNNNISISPTKYPGIDWDKIEEKANAFGCKLDYYDVTKGNKKLSRKFSLDVTGSQNSTISFNQCPMAVCTTLKNGRLAMCPLVFSVNHFNKYFNQNIPVTDFDSFDIYKAKTIQEIVDFLNKPIPLCAYCKSMGREIVGEWRKSEKKITEWTE